MISRRAAARALVALALGSSIGRAETGWEPRQVETRLTHFSGVWGSSASDVFVVGSRGIILHFDGARWARQKSGTGKNLAAVWAISGTDAFAVGLDGVILHFDRRGWKTERSGTSKSLLAIWGASASDVFAVGRGGTILHFDGRRWTPQASPTRYDLSAIWGSSATDVFAAGDHGTILRFDGTRWTQPVPSFGYHWRFTALGGTSAANVYASGSRRPSGQLSEKVLEGIVLRFDGRSWMPVQGADSQVIEGVWAQSPREVYFSGPAINGLEEVRRYDGEGFETVDSESRFSPRAIWGAPTGELFVVGSNGFVLTKKAR
ncbi:MAG TPA: hypothetical protein VKS03_02985 [Thermoanaerobaculia bacterium]|nr:hypothetical protein [Thermoanaerobaculia bacterium]